MRQLLLLLALGCALTSCAFAPPVDRDTERAMTEADAPGRFAIFRREGERIALTKFVDGNAVELLKDGPATYQAMTELIGGARRRVDMESYEFDTEEGGKFADLLIAKASQGVPVNLMYDAWGSFETPKALFDRLRQGGVQVVEYSPFNPLSVADLDLNRRDHRKLLVVDGAVAITGGVNISRVYENRRRQPQGQDPDDQRWRDTDVRITGPVVAEFQRLFVDAWHDQKGPALPPTPTTSRVWVGDLAVQAVDGAPVDQRPLIYRTLLVAITLSRTSVHLTTGFFVPTPDLERALELAAERGCDVQLIVPAESDSHMALAAGRSRYEDLLDAGVHIAERQGAVLHAKTAVIDGIWSTVGSSNLDWRSVVFNAEINAVVLGGAFGQQMEAMFQADLAASKPIDPAAWRDRPLGERLDEWTARVIEVLL
ncbi:MAG: cardiolipin synthase [Rhodospirillales bacterium]|nr:cardiolipin synthase [Rhodospirillales bacterium]